MEQLLERWRNWVDDLRQVHLDERLASFLEARIAEVEKARAQAETGILSLKEAAGYSGYHYDHIRWLVRHNRLENVGRKGSPRVRQRDLPRRPVAERPEAEQTRRSCSGRRRRDSRRTTHPQTGTP
jgi:hypothetical protein